MTHHVFEGSLHRTENSNVLLFWGDVYAAAFPGYTIGRTITSETVQKSGTDRYITSPSSEVIAVEEKHRDATFPDILLENKSSIGADSPGWMCKDLSCDYLIYGIMPAREAFVFPWHELKAAWDQNYGTWCDLAHRKASGFSYVLAPNRGYTTGSIAVPRAELLATVPGVRHITTPRRRLWGNGEGEIITA